MQPSTVSVPLSKKELTILVNAINETQEAIEEWEFSTGTDSGVMFHIFTFLWTTAEHASGPPDSDGFRALD